MLLEYQPDWIKIVDFLLIAKFWAILLLFGPPSTTYVLRMYYLVLTPFEPSSRNGWDLRVSGFAFQMPTIVMKAKALPVAMLSHRLNVRDS